ncbi:hypothetical protein AGR7C_Cc110103 [Agrobacterium deltaense Zutra 3/1]|uniref:Uncharacterized protein n=1 Tax=Agrobacterium deltaense Zutra 3/1 TaxID=1183427 RepID=A0A1S7NZD7_9HYPH|nr:hypothetical protein AGR7C_Cc110103 [Agrobacterium deltaense Zutra 3/1]
MQKHVATCHISLFTMLCVNREIRRAILRPWDGQHFHQDSNAAAFIGTIVGFAVDRRLHLHQL